MHPVSHQPWVMFGLMMVAGFLSTMNVWADSWSDIRWSLNDLYMSLLMTGWMFLGMGLLDRTSTLVWVGVGLIAVSFAAIRTQFLITETQYRWGMIPHHSMAIHMSRRLKTRDPTLETLRQAIIRTQRQEIQTLKGVATG